MKNVKPIWKYIFFPPAYAIVLCTISILINCTILLLFFNLVGEVHKLSLAVYTVYICPRYVALLGIVAGLVAARITKDETEHRKNMVIVGILSVLILGTQAYYYPRW